VQGPQIPDPLNPGGFIDDPLDEATQLRNEGLSLGGTLQKSFTFQGSLNWNPTSRTSFNIQPFSFFRQAGTTGTSTFQQKGISVFAKHKFTRHLAVRGTFFYANDDFDEGRRDNRFRERLGLEYRTDKWLGFRLDYIFEKRFSNESGRDFYSNSVMVSIQALL
jgi:hypothetical protein